MYVGISLALQALSRKVAPTPVIQRKYKRREGEEKRGMVAPSYCIIVYADV